MNVDLTGKKIAIAGAGVSIVGLAFGLGWALGRWDRKLAQPLPGPVKYDYTVSLIHVVKRMWDAGYIPDDRSIYFTTLSDIAYRAGLDVDPIHIRSAIEMAGCHIQENVVHGGDIATLFNGDDYGGLPPKNEKNADDADGWEIPPIK